MDWHNFVTSQDAQGTAKWIGVLVSSVLVFLGLERWYVTRKQHRAEQAAKEKAELEAKFAKKADLAQVEACLIRIEAYKEKSIENYIHMAASVEQLREQDNHHREIEAKLFDKIDTNDKEAFARHIALMEAINSTNRKGSRS